MPYLDCGTSGVALAFIEVYKDGNESMEFLNEEFLRRLSQGSDMVCTFNGGLFGGYVGLLPAAIALRDLGIDDELWERIIDGLNLYLMKNNGNIVPAGWPYTAGGVYPLADMHLDKCRRGYSCI